MKKKIIIIIMCLGIFLFVKYFYSNFISQDKLIGTYIYNNYMNLPTFPDAPMYPDTLTLLEDNSFRSSTWGIGKYHIKYTFGGTEIDFSYEDNGKLCGYATHIKRGFTHSPSIIIDQSLNLFFEKQEK